MPNCEYEPLDLTPFCNAGTEISIPGRTPSLGQQQFHGLPFCIGDGNTERCFIAFEQEASVIIPLQQTVRHVIFAHALLKTRLADGEPVGRVIASYVFHFADGESYAAPIRERFEIAVVPLAIESWFPLLALPDQADCMMPRYDGKWAESGYRQMEARQGITQHYYLWAWRNPQPEKSVASIEIKASGYLPFYVAAITLGHLEEEPFTQSAALPVHITLPREEDANATFALAVEVDRGTATYPYPLSPQTGKEFLSKGAAGWGEPSVGNSDQAYVEISATPSATVTVKRGEEELAHTRWGTLTEQGEAQTERVHLEVVNTGRNWVHTTVVDEETGKPLPCRVHFRSGRGIPYAPHGHHAHIHSDLDTWHVDIGGDLRLGNITYAYIDGKCQGWLPRGEVLVDVARGFEYQPLRTRVNIEPGQRELTLRLKRQQNLKADRYFSGDTHVHFLSTQGALTEAAAEDLDVVNLLLSQWGHLYTNTEEFTGGPAVSRDGGTIVYATQENRQHMLGHLTLLGLKEPVMPWCTDGPGEAEMGGNLETTLCHWADACHAQGGTVVIPHLPNPNGEPAALIATGRADAVEMLAHYPFLHAEYYRYLNGGYRLPLVGGTDKMDSGVPVGLYRTYAYIPPDEEFTYDNWLKAMRGGNTFLSGGPLLRFTVNGQPIGSTIKLSANGGTIELEASASSIFPVHSLEIVQGGHVVASTEEEKGTGKLHLRATLKIESDSWLCARCGGPGYTTIKHHDSWKRGIMAHTSPIYLTCGDNYNVFSPETAQYMLTLVDGSVQYMRHHARQWQPGTVTHHHGERDHQAFLERPFQEAKAALHQKLHEHGIAH